MDCRNRKGKFSKGAKITNVEFSNENEILITTNDSRLRLFNIENFKQVVKYKGYKNQNFNIGATFK